MKLVVTVKLLLTKNKNRLLFILLICNTLQSNLTAQQYQHTYSNTPLSEALLEASKQLNVKVAFDAKKLGNISINKSIVANSADDYFNLLLENSGFTFKFKHGQYLIVDAPSPEISSCQIIGVVADAETGEQLPFATIKTSSKNLSTQATSNGSFFIKSNKPGPLSLNISYIGYYSIDTTINCENSFYNIDIKLNRKLQELDKVVINEPKIEMVEYRNDVDFATTINPSKLIDLPSLAETDVFKALQLLPGISYSENSAELSIRGGSSDQNLVLFDGQTLYSLSHYFGVFSALNNNIIKDVQVYKGGYESRYGERVSGIVDITGKSGNNMKPLIYGDMNFVSGNLVAEIPVTEKLSIIAAARRSYSDIYSTELADSLFKRNTGMRPPNPKDSNSITNITTPSYFFYDYNFKATYKLSNKESVSISALGGKDNYSNGFTDSTKRFSSSVQESNTWYNKGVSASWVKQWNSSFFSDIQFGGSSYSNSASNNRTMPVRGPGSKELTWQNNFNKNSTYENNLTDISFSARNSLTLNDQNQLGFGFLARRNSIVYQKNLDTNPYDNTNQSATAWVTSAYVQDKIHLVDKLTIKPGIRFSEYSGNNKIYFEPRLAMNYQFNDKLSVRAAAGRYYQFISQVSSPLENGYNKDFWVLTDDSIHPALQSNHIILGTSVELSNIFIDFEAYYKTYSGFQEYFFVSPYIQDSISNGFNDQIKKTMAGSIDQQKPQFQNLLGTYFNGTGESYGLDFSLRYKFNIYTSWISYSLSKSTQQFEKLNNNAVLPAPTDQRHQLCWANMVSWRKWNFGTTTLFATGRPYLIQPQNDNKGLPTSLYYKRLPNYFRTDISANYNFKIKKARIKVGATIINLFNTNNYYDISTRNFNFANASFTETNKVRAQNLSLNCFVHFVF